MEINVLTITLAVLALLILAFVVYFLFCLAMFIGQEINHSVRKMKRDIRDSIWDLEWKWKLFTKRR